MKASTFASIEMTSPFVVHGGFASALSKQPRAGVAPPSYLSFAPWVQAGSSATPLPSAFRWQSRMPVVLALAHLIFAELHANGVGGPPARAPAAHKRNDATDSTAATSSETLFTGPPRGAGRASNPTGRICWQGRI